MANCLPQLRQELESHRQLYEREHEDMEQERKRFQQHFLSQEYEQEIRKSALAEEQVSLTNTHRGRADCDTIP